MENIIFDANEDYKKAIKMTRETKQLLSCEDEYFDSFTGFSETTPLFRFTNENLSEYYDLFDFNNKDVLTVIGSGDQALSAIYKGAKTTDVFDINIISYYLLMLKYYCVKFLSYEDYISFFNPSEKLSEIDLLYKKISSKIDNDNIKKFWDLIFNNINYFYFLFLDSGVIINRVKKNVPYLTSEKSYEKLKEKLPNANINFIGKDLINLTNEIEKKYDYINLSNIIDYIHDKKLAKKVYSKIFNNLLNKDGMCIMEYEWYYNACCNDYIENLFIKYPITKHTMQSEEFRPSSAYIYKKRR